VFTAAERVESLTDEFPTLSVAAYNGANTVLSGPAQDLEKAVAGLAADGVRCDWLDTSHAFHSALLDPILDEFESYAGRFNFSTPQRILVDNRTGAALGRSVKLDGGYWRRHARQPVEFAKSVRTLADLNCKVLLEIGPRPVLTAAALGAWPDPATAPRAITSMRRNTADHRQITEAVADAYVLGHLPEFSAFRQAHARKLDLPTYPFERRQYWFRDNKDKDGHHAQQHLAARTQAVRLLEDGRIEELATLLDGASGDHQTLSVLTKLAAQHNQQRTTQSIAADRYEIRWEKSSAPFSGAEAGEESTWILIGDATDAVQPLIDVLTARGHRHRILGLPVSDADEEKLADALRAAYRACRGPRLRDRAVDAVTVADATPDPGRHTAALPRRDCR
jgi:acyl transferase domain-containing protein